jgi:16S rRNA (guanine527-N7)-methyltransferase
MFHVKQIEQIETICHSMDILEVDHVVQQFRVYGQLLIRWNRKMNLISKNDEERIVPRHFLESIGFVRAVRFPRFSRIIDLGSGAGLPGIPIKLIRPDLYVYLVESKHKKACFLEMVIRSLSLQNIQVICNRIEKIENRIEPVDIIISRSVASLEMLVKWSMPLLKRKTGMLVAIKGEKLDEEVKSFRILAERLRLTKWEIITYNPFPKIYPLSNSALVLVWNC